MRLDVDALVEAALADASVPKPASKSPASEFSKLASELEDASRAKPQESQEERERFHKLAMAVILDACEDPKAKHGLEALSQDIVKAASGGGYVVGDRSPDEHDSNATKQTVIIEKQQVARGRTLFKKLQDASPAPAAETNG